jgi:RNA polymerase sigma factor (sigma-70 family)
MTDVNTGLAGSAVASESRVPTVADLLDQIEMHRVAAYRLAIGMLTDHGEAEDAVQEAATLAWRRRAQLRRDRPFAPWFLAIVANRCRDRHRSRWWKTLKVARFSDFALGSSSDQPADLDLRKALRSLSPRLRAAVVLRYWLDLPVHEVAVALKCSDAAAETRIRRGLLQLRPLLQPQEDHQ